MNIGGEKNYIVLYTILFNEKSAVEQRKVETETLPGQSLHLQDPPMEQRLI